MEKSYTSNMLRDAAKATPVVLADAAASIPKTGAATWDWLKTTSGSVYNNIKTFNASAKPEITAFASNVGTSAHAWFNKQSNAFHKTFGKNSHTKKDPSSSSSNEDEILPTRHMSNSSSPNVHMKVIKDTFNSFGKAFSEGMEDIKTVVAMKAGYTKTKDLVSHEGSDSYMAFADAAELNKKAAPAALTPSVVASWGIMARLKYDRMKSDVSTFLVNPEDTLFEAFQYFEDPSIWLYDPSVARMHSQYALSVGETLFWKRFFFMVHRIDAEDR